MALAARRSSRRVDLRSRGTALGASDRRGNPMPSAAHPQRDRPGGGRQAARDSQTRTLRRRSFSHFARAFDGAVRARIREHAGRDAADGLPAQSRVRAASVQSRSRWRHRDLRAALPIRWRPRASIVSASLSFIAAWIATAFARQRSQERADARGALGISDGEILISAVGALEQRKGHRYLIEADRSARGNREVQVFYRWSGCDS